MATRTLLSVFLVFGIVGAGLSLFFSLLTPNDPDAWRPFAVLAIGGAIVVGVPLALVVGVAAAGVRAWSKRRAAADSQAA
jgi:hypothetical protein